MKYDRYYIVSIVMMVFFSIIWNILEQPVSWVQIYDGIGFSSRMTGYMIQFFLYSVYSFAVMGIRDRWFLYGGFYTILRKKTRKYIFFQTLKTIALLLLYLESIKIVGSIFIVICCEGLADVGIKSDFLSRQIVFWEMILLLSFLQELWEWIFGSKTALIIMWIYYLSSLFIGDVCVRNGWKLNVLFLLIPNLGMNKRIQQTGFDKRNVMIWLLFGLAVVLTVLYRFIRKKDFWQE